MKKTKMKLVSTISLIIIAAVSGAPLSGHAAPEVTAWGSCWNDSTNVPITVPGGLSNVVAVATGGNHSLALTAEGLVVAWGRNDHGQITVPVGLSNVVAIAAGGDHSLALTTEGRVVAWGAGTNNTDSYPNYGQSQVPSGLSNVVAIAAGQHHTLALTTEGRVVSWGWGPNWNWIGHTIVPGGLCNVVAIAAGGYRSLALTAEGRVVAWGSNEYGTVPNGLSNVVAITAGGDHSLALTAEGRVVAWGNNQSGQRDVPYGLSNVVAIAAGEMHSLALTAEGRVVGWGGYWNGSTYVPRTVPSGFSNVVAIAAGGNLSLALSGLPSGVAVPAWVGPRYLVGTVDRPFHHWIIAKNGITTYGADGLPPGLSLDPNTGLITGQPAQAGMFSVLLSAANSRGSNAWTVILYVNLPLPAIVNQGLVVAGLGCGFNSSVEAYNAPDWYGTSGLPAGLAFDPQTRVISGVPIEAGDFLVSLVASNRYGLGASLLNLRVSPVAGWGANGYGLTNAPSELSNAVAIASGAVHNLALTFEGRVVAWGDNYSGQTNVPGGLSNVVAIAAGERHSLALTSEGQVVAWGDNYSGQTNVPRGLSNVVAIAAGGENNLALTSEGRVVAWGMYNNNSTWVPMTVPSGLSNVMAIAAGGSHSLALTAEGRVVAWGMNNAGQTNVPSGLSNVVAIAAGMLLDPFIGGIGHSLALTADGRVVAWGAGGPGTADYGYCGQATVPDGLSNVVAIAAGAYHSLALTAEGRVVVWGASRFGLTNVPTGLSNVVSIAAGGGHSLALCGLPPGLAAPAGTGPRLLVATADRPFYHRILAKNSVTIYGADGLPPGLSLDPITGLITGRPTQIGTYSVVLSATNSVGSSEWMVTLFVNSPYQPMIASLDFHGKPFA